jgi:hypothetical protein
VDLKVLFLLNIICFFCQGREEAQKVMKDENESKKRLGFFFFSSLHFSWHTSNTFFFFFFFFLHIQDCNAHFNLFLACSFWWEICMNECFRVSCDELLLLNANLHGNLGLCRRATEAKQRRKQQSEKKTKLGQTESNDGGALEASNTDASKSETPQKPRKKKKHHHRKTNEAASSDDQLQIPTSASTILDDTIVQFLKTKER